MIDVGQLLYDLNVYSGNGYGYTLTYDAINILILSGEDLELTLAAQRDTETSALFLRRFPKRHCKNQPVYMGAKFKAFRKVRTQ